MKLFLPIITLILPLLFAPFATIEAQNSHKGGVPGGFDDSFGKLPTHITSDTLTFNAKTRLFSYQGNVQVTQGDMNLTAKTIDGTYNEKNQLQKLVAKGDVIITKQDIHATGQVASYDAVTAVVTLTDNPQLQQQESILRADRIKIFLNENRSQAEGDVRVTFVNTKGAGVNPEAVTAVQPSPTPAGTSPSAKPLRKSAPIKKKATSAKRTATKSTRTKK